MKVYRVCHNIYANDLSGNGARLHGGRWNSPGLPALYTSSSQSLAILELLANTSSAILQQHFLLLTIAIPPGASIRKIAEKDLPVNWNIFPAPLNIQKKGDQWLKEGKELLLKVPSVIVPAEFNYVINPMHPDIGKVRVLSSQALVLDKRIIQGI